MPADLVERINQTVTTAARTAAVRQKLAGDGIEPILSTSAEFARFLNAEREQWIAVARNIGFKREK